MKRNLENVYFRLNKSIEIFNIFNTINTKDMVPMFISLKNFINDFLSSNIITKNNDIILYKISELLSSITEDSKIKDIELISDLIFRILSGGKKLIIFPNHYKAVDFNGVVRYGYPVYRKFSNSSSYKLYLNIIFNQSKFIRVSKESLKLFTGYFDREGTPLYEGDRFTTLEKDSLFLVDFNDPHSCDGKIGFITEENGVTGVTTNYDLTFIPMIDYLSVGNHLYETKGTLISCNHFKYLTKL